MLATAIDLPNATHEHFTGRHYQRGRVGIVGGHRAGSLVAVEALSLASGRPLVKTLPPGPTQHVAFVVRPADERTLDFRLHSTMAHHGLTLDSIGDRVGFLLVDGDLEGALNALESFIEARQIEVLLVDAVFAGDPELWTGLARECDVAAMLVLPDADLDAALVGAAASVRMARAFHGSLCQINDLKRGGSCIVSL